MVVSDFWFYDLFKIVKTSYYALLVEFSMPRDEAKKLITAYNTVYELSIPYELIEDGLARCINLKGHVVIDDLLKVLSKVK